MADSHTGDDDGGLRATLREADPRLLGLVLLTIGLGWVALSPLAGTIPGPVVGAHLPSVLRNPLSSLMFGAVGIGTAHLVIGLSLVGAGQLGRRITFSESVIVGGLAVLLGIGSIVLWEISQGSPVRADLIVSFQAFAGYVVAWAFPLGVASTRRERITALCVLCAIPIVLLLAVPLLILLDGGWMVVIALVSIPVTLVLIPLGLVVALPVMATGWAVRPQPESRLDDPDRRRA